MEKIYKLLGFKHLTVTTLQHRCPHCQSTKREHFDAATPRGVVPAWLCDNCKRGYDKEIDTFYWAKEKECRSR
ncbi:hypothetical protein pD_gene0049 [Vibrio phage 033B]|nr:hypothetical protein pD_gene0049 [Vibrio phage 033B]